MAEYVVSDTTLQTIADAIRAKGSTSALLACPDGFVSAIEALAGSWNDLAAFKANFSSNAPTALSGFGTVTATSGSYLTTK